MTALTGPDLEIVDLATLTSAYVEPDGTVHRVPDWSHRRWAEDRLTGTWHAERISTRRTGPSFDATRYAVRIYGVAGPGVAQRKPLRHKDLRRFDSQSVCCVLLRNKKAAHLNLSDCRRMPRVSY